MHQLLKYPTYESLIAAYKSGELTEPLIVDNDTCFVYVRNKIVFRGEPTYDFHHLCNLLGIPTDWA